MFPVHSTAAANGGAEGWRRLGRWGVQPFNHLALLCCCLVVGTHCAGPIVTLAVIARLTGFEAEDYHHPAPKLVGPIIGAIVGGLTARGLEVWVAKKWAAYFSGLYDTL